MAYYYKDMKDLVAGREGELQRCFDFLGLEPLAGIDAEPVALNTALDQLANVSQMPFVHHHVAAMPDVHAGIGATVGSVIPTKGAIIPAAVGVDIA